MTDMRLSKEAAARAAGRLTAAGEDLDGQWKSAVGRINGLSGDAIWGSDEGGQKGSAAYNAAVPQLIENAQQLVGSMVRLGPLVQQGVAGLLTADEMSAQMLAKPGDGSAEGGAADGAGPSAGAGTGSAAGGGPGPSSRPGSGR